MQSVEATVPSANRKLTTKSLRPIDRGNLVKMKAARKRKQTPYRVSSCGLSGRPPARYPPSRPIVEFDDVPEQDMPPDKLVRNHGQFGAGLGIPMLSAMPIRRPARATMD